MANEQNIHDVYMQAVKDAVALQESLKNTSGALKAARSAFNDIKESISSTAKSAVAGGIRSPLAKAGVYAASAVAMNSIEQAGVGMLAGQIGQRSLADRYAFEAQNQDQFFGAGVLKSIPGLGGITSNANRSVGIARGVYEKADMAKLIEGQYDSWRETNKNASGQLVARQIMSNQGLSDAEKQFQLRMLENQQSGPAGQLIDIKKTRAAIDSQVKSGEAALKKAQEEGGIMGLLGGTADIEERLNSVKKVQEMMNSPAMKTQEQILRKRAEQLDEQAKKEYTIALTGGYKPGSFSGFSQMIRGNNLPTGAPSVDPSINRTGTEFSLEKIMTETKVSFDRLYETQRETNRILKGHDIVRWPK